MTIDQGTAIIEPDGEGALLVMYPTGTVELALSAAAAERKARRWFNHDAKERLRGGAGLAIGKIEWRYGAQPAVAHRDGGDQ